MDIPNTGAIFTLGKSHLAENTQSYFYIKNDPIKRVVSGPHQSAVICESGRLFVWGENCYGQLGIGGHSNGNSNCSSSSSNHSNTGNRNHNNGRYISNIVTKPTCVKSLKTLGVKMADITFGNDWAVMLAHSNELFYSGRSIFPNNTKNFTETEVDGTKCSIIRKPFRLEEFDDWLSHNEEEENFVSVLAGNEHFAVMTSSGRLIGWGSNANHQLGQAETEDGHTPLEIVLDSPIQQFACGPESTLVLTESGNLYLTGKLNEFVFPQFTELQKNLSPNEQIIFMHISKASEIYIVTNTGSIYRSFETLRNKSLIFQRFYDYDSEENGPIWKLLKGLSFYAVLTKANKFYTTFSESGHHLKTFREISKFRNLRLLDMAVGDRHILVHGVPRSSTLSATVGMAGGTHQYMSRTMVMPEINGRVSRGRSGKSHVMKEAVEEEKPEDQEKEKRESTKVVDNDILNPKVPLTNEEVSMRLKDDEQNHNRQDELNLKPTDSNSGKIEGLEVELIEEMETGRVSKLLPDVENNTSSNVKSPTPSLRSHKSARSIKFDEHTLYKNASSEQIKRPRTPYPDSSITSTPATTKKAIRNFSYEAAMEHDAIENTTPVLHESYEDITEDAGEGERKSVFMANIKTPTPPCEEDEELTVEIETTTNELDQTVVNEIRFINNGVDVTPKVDTKMSEDSISIESELNDEGKELSRAAGGLLSAVDGELNGKAKQIMEARDSINEEIQETGDKITQNIDTKFKQATKSMESAGQNVVAGVHNTVKDFAKKAGDKAMETTNILDQTMSTLNKEVSDLSKTMNKLTTEMITETKPSHTSANESPNRGENREQDEPGSKPESASKRLQLPTAVTEDDERTTASVNSFESSNAFDHGHESPNGGSNKPELEQQEAEKRKGRMLQFLSDMRSKSKNISCRSDKDIRIEDEPPRYTPEEELRLGNSSQLNNNSNTSKVCTIL